MDTPTERRKYLMQANTLLDELSIDNVDEGVIVREQFSRAAATMRDHLINGDLPSWTLISLMRPPS
jgi:hypothetical protein